MSVDTRTVMAPAAATIATRHSTLLIAAAALAMFVVLQTGLNLLLPRIELTISSLAVAFVMLAVALGFERLVYRRNVARSFAALGWTWPRSGAVVAAVLISGGMVAFFPVYAAATGTQIGLRTDWLWILIGAVALNGLAEETLFRGFVFGHLRTSGLSFRRAGVISLLVFGAVHLYLFTANPPEIAAIATLLAVAAGFPFAFLYERAGMSIWAGVIVHVAAHTYRLLDLPADQAMTVAGAWLLFQFLAVFAVFAFRNSLLRSAD